MLVECHNHSAFSFDADCPVEEMAEAARQAGIGVFAITDHCEANQWEEHNLSHCFPASVAATEAAKENAGLILLTGIELGQPLQAPGRAEEALGEKRLDFVIGSLHNVSNRPDFYFIDYIGMSREELMLLFRQYYRELLEMARWGGFDTLAHIGYPYRYLNEARRKKEIDILPEYFDEEADRVLEALASRQKALELNTSRLALSAEDYRLNERYLKRFWELGGKYVTLGTDAHSPEQITNGLNEGIGLLKKTGFDKVTYYEKRKPVMAEL